MQDFIDDELDDNLDDVEPIVDNPAELYEHFRVVVDKGQKQVRIDKYLFERLVNSSRNRIQKAADAGFVMANGKPVKSSYKVAVSRSPSFTSFQRSTRRVVKSSYVIR